MSNRIQELILLLENEIDQSPKQRLGSGNKRVVDCDNMLDLLGDLKVVIPEEVRLAQTILSEREAILAEAESKSTAILANARMEAERLIANDTTMAQAKIRARDMVSQAENESDELTQGARDYAQTIMEEVQKYLTHYIELIDGTRDDLRRNYQPSIKKKGNDNINFGIDENYREEKSDNSNNDVIDTLEDIRDRRFDSARVESMGADGSDSY